MGALTSKKTQFNYRPWETKSLDSADFLDSFCTPIQLNVRSNNVIRVLPRLSKDKQVPWISDRTRFFIDGLTRERIQTPLWYKHYVSQTYLTPFYKNANKPSVFSISWNFAFTLIKRHYTSAATTVLGPNVDYTSIAMISNVFNDISVDNGGSRLPTPSIRHLSSGKLENNSTITHIGFGAYILNASPTWDELLRVRRVGYILVNLNLHRFPLLEYAMQQMSCLPGHQNNYWYTFGNNYRGWEPFLDYLGPITKLFDYVAGKMTGVVQMSEFDTIVFLNGHWGEDSHFMSGDDLAKLLLDYDWGLKHDRIYIYDLPVSHREFATSYMHIRNTFYPRWKPEHLNINEFLFMHDDPNVATAALEKAQDDVEDTIGLDKGERELGIYVRFGHGDWRKAPGFSKRYIASTQPAHRRTSSSSHGRTTSRSLSPFLVSYGPQRSSTASKANLILPGRQAYETTTSYAIDCFGRVARFAFCYPGPTYSKDSIDMFTELATNLQLSLSLNIPSPLSFLRTYSTPFFVDTPNITFSRTSNTYIYDTYRVDAITKASPIMALCSERFYPREVNFDLIHSNRIL
jgi:hypothetical protein